MTEKEIKRFAEKVLEENNHIWTVEEAENHIQRKICGESPVYHYCRDTCMRGKNHCPYDVALEALKKQIPKKPIKNRLGDHYCPMCKKRVFHAFRHCCHCGQKLDWSEE